MTRLLANRPLSSLRDHFNGRVLTPGSPGYDTARAVWNGAIDHHPALIARCSGPEDVVTALRFARSEHLEVSVRGGGHSFSGASVVPDGVVVDLSEMHRVEVDPQARTARCESGATLAQLDAATQAHGLAVPVGTISHTGVAGLTLGGGFGWLTGMYGLTVDNLLSADIVLADGTRLVASEQENPDLFWGLRGGGGNFGVVTSFTYLLHPVGPEVHVGLFFWEIGAGGDALRLIRDTIPGLPSRTGVLTGVGMSAPPEPFVPAEHRSALGHALIVAGFGSAEQHTAALAPLAAGPPTLFEMHTRLAYTELQSMLDDAAPPGILGYERALPLAELTDDVIELLGVLIPGKKSPMSFCPTFRLDGAYAAEDDDASAFGGVREPTYMLNMAAIAPEPAMLTADSAWARRLWTGLLPHSTGPGGYVNFMFENEEERVRAAYGAAKYDRLAHIKTAYDPDNVFHRNANVRPAAV